MKDELTQLEAVIIDNGQQALDGMVEKLGAEQGGSQQTMALTARHAVIAAFAVLANKPDNGMTPTARSLINETHDRCLALMKELGVAKPD